MEPHRHAPREVKNALIASAINNGGTGAPVGVGLMNTQILAGMLGLTALPANQPGGTNYEPWTQPRRPTAISEI
jgi:hypothetical protein